MKSQMGGLRRKFLANKLRGTKFNSAAKKTDKEKQDNAIEWITFYRRNWDIFAIRVLQIKLKPFQRVMLYLMGVSDVFWAICSRGLSKSTICGLAAIIKCLLYPYSEVVITSSTVAQANKMAEKRIQDDIIKKLSPYLLHCLEKEYIIITKPDDGYCIRFTLNNSSIIVLAALDSSRGERATLLIYEEARLLKKSIIDSVFEKMGHPRGAIYMQNPEYANNKRWQEQAQSFYITSARYKYEWFWRSFKTCFIDHFLDKKTRNNIFAGDIFMAIDNGLKTWGDYRKGKRANELEFRIEDLNEMIGEAEDAFFSYKSFNENQKIEKCFKPLTPFDLSIGKESDFPKKGTNEIRIVAVDYAFANTVKGGEKNDNTMVICYSGHWNKDHFSRQVDYIESHSASDSIGAADRARELWELYEADVLLPDLRNGGETLFNYMTMPWTPDFGKTRFSGRGLMVYDKPWVHVVPDAKLADLRDRTVDKNAVPAIVPFIGTAELNQLAWTELKKQLEINNIKFLVSAQQHQEDLEDSGEYFKLTSEELVQELLPYGQTDEMIHEAVNLSLEITTRGFRLREPRSGTKDRAVILSYANYIMSLFENQWQKMFQNDDFDIDEIQLIW